MVLLPAAIRIALYHTAGAKHNITTASFPALHTAMMDLCIPMLGESLATAILVHVHCKSHGAWPGCRDADQSTPPTR